MCACVRVTCVRAHNKILGGKLWHMVDDVGVGEIGERDECADMEYREVVLVYNVYPHEVRGAVRSAPGTDCG